MPPPAANRESQSHLEDRRKRRVAAIWILGGVVIAGIVAGWLGWPRWGPRDSFEVRASGAIFWLAVGMLGLCIRDLISIRRHGSRPPTYEDLDEDAGRFRKPANVIRRWMSKNQALVGVIGLASGALLGHFYWQV